MISPWSGSWGQSAPQESSISCNELPRKHWQTITNLLLKMSVAMVLESLRTYILIKHRQERIGVMLHTHSHLLNLVPCRRGLLLVVLQQCTFLHLYGWAQLRPNLPIQVYNITFRPFNYVKQSRGKREQESGGKEKDSRELGGKEGMALGKQLTIHLLQWKFNESFAPAGASLGVYPTEIKPIAYRHTYTHAKADSLVVTRSEWMNHLWCSNIGSCYSAI